MSVPPSPQPFEALAQRTFAFFPPVLNVEHNEWRLGKATWSEVLVINTRCDVHIWIPRRYFGEISSVDDPIMIVGLTKELEYKAGTVFSHEKRVIEMPGRLHSVPEGAPGEAAEPVPVIGVRHGTSAESRVGRLVLAALLIGLVLCFIVVSVFRQGPLRPVKFTALDQDFLGLNRYDDYFAVVRKLGQPKEDRWRSEAGDLQYRLLWYPDRSYYVILLGTERGQARYIGALDRNWRVVHYVELPNGGNTGSMLRTLAKF